MPLRFPNPITLFRGIGENYISFKCLKDNNGFLYIPREVNMLAQKICDFSGKRNIEDIVYHNDIVNFTVKPKFESQEIAYEILKEFRLL